MRKSKKTSKTRQKFDLEMELKVTTLLSTCFWIIAMHSVCRCSLRVWRRSLLKKGTPVTYFGPTLDPPLIGSGRKTTTLIRDHEYFIPSKFNQNLSSGSGEEVKSVNVHGRTTDGRRRTDDVRFAMTIAHLSLRLRWANKIVSLFPFPRGFFPFIIFHRYTIFFPYFW